MMNPKLIVSRHLQALLAFPERMRLVSEHIELSKKLEHLEKRYNIDKVSDPGLAREVKEEITKTQGRIKDILEKLSF